MSIITVLPLNLPLVKYPTTHQQLYPHQAAMLDAWDDKNSFLLVTKTGTGKTIGAILPILKKRQRAICVYPTNELIQDQVHNITKIAKREDLKVCIQTPDTTPEEYVSADVVLVHIDSNILAVWCEKRHLQEKWRALRELLEADKPKIILTNPDILFLIFALRYHAEPLAALSGYSTLVVDEFHLYSGLELSHALFMLHLGRNLGTFKKIVLLSATPSPKVLELLNKILDHPCTIDISVKCPYPIVGNREAVKSVKIVPRLTGADVIETAVKIIKEIEKEIKTRRESNLSHNYVPAVVIVNSVVNAIRLEDRLVEEGLQREDMAIIRGLSAKGSRKVAGKYLAIGTSAIEVGIDFQCDFLIFEAGEAAMFMQRFGRVGRHSPGIAYLLCEQNVLMGIEALISKRGQEVERGEFEEHVYNWYPSLKTRTWFVSTYLGILSAFSLAENLITKLRDDFKVHQKEITHVEKRIELIYSDYINKIDCSEQMIHKVMRTIKKMRQGEPEYEWLGVYRDLNTFRTSLPSEWVLDFAEFERRNSKWEQSKYKVDIGTLLRRAENLRFNEKIPHPDGVMGMLTVKGYGRYKKVWVIPTFTDDDCGFPHCTSDFPHLSFIQEGHKTSVSHVMTFRNHIFAIVPRNILPNLDWRLQVFECGKHLVGFDGTALLLIELLNASQ